jgi:hypothetical protein
VNTIYPKQARDRSDAGFEVPSLLTIILEVMLDAGVLCPELTRPELTTALPSTGGVEQMAHIQVSIHIVLTLELQADRRNAVQYGRCPRPSMQSKYE